MNRFMRKILGSPTLPDVGEIQPPPTQDLEEITTMDEQVLNFASKHGAPSVNSSIVIKSLPEWQQFGEMIFNTLNGELKSIFYFERQINKQYPGMMDKTRKTIKDFTFYAAFIGWLAGRLCGQNNPSLREKYLHSTEVKLDDLPSEEKQLLLLSIEPAYQMWAKVFTSYYESEIGAKTRSQKEVHFKNVYQALVRGLLYSFVSGVRSNIPS